MYVYKLWDEMWVDFILIMDSWFYSIIVAMYKPSDLATLMWITWTYLATFWISNTTHYIVATDLITMGGNAGLIIRT